MDILRGEGPASVLVFSDVIWRRPVCLPPDALAALAASTATGRTPSGLPRGTGAAAAAMKTAGALGSAVLGSSGSAGGASAGRGLPPDVHGFRASEASNGADSNGTASKEHQPVMRLQVACYEGQCYNDSLQIVEALLPVVPRSEEIGAGPAGGDGEGGPPGGEGGEAAGPSYM